MADNYTMLVRSGQYVDPFNLREDQILITDIAHSLAMSCRYGGHTSDFYSVAQHSWLLSLVVPDHLKKAALIHDGAEGYISDMVHPLKLKMPDFKALDVALTKKIFRRFDVDYELMKEIEFYDRSISINEMEALMPEVDPFLLKNFTRLPDVNISPMNFRVAFQRFLSRFEELWPDEWPARYH